MRAIIQALVQKVVLSEIEAQLARQEGAKLTPEQFSEKVASMVASSLPNFKEETKRDFDDPHDSFSTELFVRFTTDWVEKWTLDRS